VFESPRDDHLVLRVDGTAERWSVTASSAGPKTVGQWAVTGSVLSLTWTGGAQTSQAFTMYSRRRSRCTRASSCCRTSRTGGSSGIGSIADKTSRPGS
jgi:hypothetical protein